MGGVSGAWPYAFTCVRFCVGTRCTGAQLALSLFSILHCLLVSACHFLVLHSVSARVFVCVDSNSVSFHGGPYVGHYSMAVNYRLYQGHCILYFTELAVTISSAVSKFCFMS